MTTAEFKERFPHATADTIRLNARLLQPSGKPPQSSPVLADKTPPRPKEGAKRIRQNSAGLNKTEQAFFDCLKESHPGALVYSQSVTLGLANGVRYTPDFVVREFSVVAAYEVKGFMRDDAAVKLKVAASLYPWILFHLVTRKGGQWQVDRVLP